MAQTQSYQRAMFVYWFKVALLLGLSCFLIFSITYIGVNYSALRTQWSINQLRYVVVLVFTGCFVILITEVGMLILLRKAILTKSFSKTRLWVILSFIFFMVHFIVFILEACALGWSSANTITMLGLFFEVVAINIMYDFMVEVRRRSRPPPLPFTPPPTSLPAHVEIPLTTFKLNNLSPRPCYSNVSFEETA